MRVSDALSPTSLAAVGYYFQNQTQIRVYCQARDMSLRERVHNTNRWFSGQLTSWYNPFCLVLIEIR